MSGRVTKQQAKLLSILANGLTIEQAAERMGVSTSTAKNHLTLAYAKLNVKNRYGAFLELGWLTPPNIDEL